MMQSGQLRHRVQIQYDENHGTPESDGGPQTASWVTLGTRWANVLPLSGRERFTAKQVQSDVTHKVEMHYDPTVATKPVYRLLYGDRVLEIDSVVNVDERNRKTLLMVKEVVT